jgi:hypothetical protein
MANFERLVVVSRVTFNKRRGKFERERIGVEWRDVKEPMNVFIGDTVLSPLTVGDILAAGCITFRRKTPHTVTNGVPA